MKQRCFLVLITILIIALLPSSFTKSEELNDDDGDTKERTFVTKDIGYNFLHAYRSTLRNGLRGVEEGWGNGATLQCLIDIVKLKNDTGLLMQYIDAVGKPRSGLLRGNIVWLGSYAECRDIPGAHYCTTNLGISVPKSISPKHNKLGALWGLCFPSSCTVQDVTLYLEVILKQVEEFTKYELRFQPSHVKCPANKPAYTTGVKATIALCGVLLFLCFIGTTIDLLDETFSISLRPNDIRDIATHKNNITMVNHDRTNSITSSVEVDAVEQNGLVTSSDVVLLNRGSFSVRVHNIILTVKGSFFGRFFQCFSVLQNTSKIFKTDVTPTAIKSINGVRVFSISWVILGHTFLNLASPLVENKAGMLKDAQLLSLMPILSGTYSVDTFFFLSGLLVAYTCFRKLEKNDGSFNWFLFYVHRFWRLTPSYMFVILFSIHLKGFLTESPFWYSQFNDPKCSDNWWTNLLYINNFYPKSGNEECIAWSWYLANDMQFFVITPFLIYPLYKVGWRGLVLPLGLLLEASAITAFIHAHWDIDPLVMLKFVKLLLNPAAGGATAVREFFTYIYSKPYCRIQVYLVGFLLGYIMHRYSNTKTRSPGWITTLLGWSAAFVLAMLLVYGPHKSILPGAAEWNGAEKVLYGTFHRFLWGLVLAWVTYACHYGAGGLVQKFLSARFWIPLSRLTYNVYLIHFIILILMFYGAQGTLHYDLYTATYYFLANVVLSFGAAYILAVCIEFPCANLEELILSYIRKARKRAE